MKTLGVKILPRDSRQNDPHVLIKAVCGQWLPLSQAVLGELKISKNIYIQMIKNTFDSTALLTI